MTPAARAQAVIEILEAIAAAPRPADAVIGSYFRARRYIGAKDRAAVAEASYTLLRHHARLGWWCDHYRAPVTARTRLIVWQRLALQENDAAIAALFSGGKFAPAALDVAEQLLLKNLRGHDLFLHPKMPLAVRYEVPEWIVPQLTAQFGDRLEAELAALLEPAPLDLRVNALKAERAAVAAELRAAGITVSECRLAPHGLRLDARIALPTLPAFKAGRVEVQDEGSQLVALLADAPPGMRVVDFCAGAGGKTLAMAAAMANKGRVLALDVLDKRLARAAERFRRAGAFNIETRALTGTDDPWIKRHKAGFDRVLVDAPCGGSGTWRRNPDARWRSLGPGLAELVPLQQTILRSAARLVKPGGRLIYATCSLLDEENQAQVQHFLADHADFTLLPYGAVWDSLTSAPRPCAGDLLQLTPAQHGTDGFFAAIMVRQSPPAADTPLEVET